MFRRLLNAPIDWFILVIPIILVIMGIITIYTITYSSQTGSLAISQLVYAILGLVLMFLLMFSDYRILRSLAWPLFLAGLLLMVPLLPPLASHLPFVSKAFGANRWINLGIFQLQPAEIFKLIIAIFGAHFIASQWYGLTWRPAMAYLLLNLIPIVLIIVEPDLGTAVVVMVIAGSLFFAARPSRGLILFLVIIVALSGTFLAANLKPYQKNRLTTFLNPSSDPLKQGYNVRQSLIAVGSGGLTGRGFGQGSQTVLNFLPVAHTDFIFAGFAEATGFLGSVVLVGLYLLLLWRVVAIAREADDRFATLLAIAIGWKLFFQAFVNIGMNIGLLPVTGIPLPFISYGGTALIIDLAGIGILESIYIRHKKIVFH
jgi:rod shape determining protein RodA